MRLQLSLFLAVAACSLGAQTLDSTTQFLVDRAQADRDSFGAGRPDGFSLETQVQKSNSGFQLQITEDKWVEKDDSDPSLVGTSDGAEMYFKRTLNASDLVVTGQVLKQLSILNTNKSQIVTDYLVQVNNVLYSKQAFDVANGSTLVIARLGGRVQINGHPVVIQVADFPSFVNGRSYIFVLHKSKLSDSFLIESEDAFELNGESIRAVRGGRIHPADAYLNDKESFIAATRKFGAEVGR